MSSSPAGTWSEPTEVQTGEVRKLSTLLEASQARASTLDLKEALQRVLATLGRYHGVVRSTVVLLNEETGDVEVEASNGTMTPGKRVRYRMGEGITGKVVETGQPIVVSKVSCEPTFLHRASKRPELAAGELSYICVPITLDDVTIGALGVDLNYKKDPEYD